LLTRRDFLKASTAATTIGLTKPIEVLASRYQNSSGFFGVHPFIEANPDAVFIMRTNVDVKTNAEALRQTGLDFGRSAIVPMSEEDGGVPLTHKVAIKPNITCTYTDNGDYDIEYRMGIITDPYFVEGVIDGMKELGISGDQIYMREANCPGDFEAMGYTAMAERTGTDLLGGVSSSDSASLLNWVDTPEGMAFRKIPYIWPINSPDSWLLNIAKLKAHSMGLTLTAKNHQGSVALGYCHFCGGMSGVLGLTQKNPNAKTDITESYEMNKAAGIPRWDKPGTVNDQNGIGMEVWAQRTMDNHTVTNTGLFVIEGVYGRDGNGFLKGPNPEGNDDNYNGESWDYMTNIIIFGKNTFHVDNIGHWLAGHEPGNMGYLHIASQRGFTSILNPENIPVYEWKNGEATRTPLKTYYLHRNYDGQTETKYHLVNEPFDYPPSTKVEYPGKPEALVLGQNHPNPFNPLTSIEYNLPTGGSVRLEIYNTAGQLVDVLANGYRSAGSHMAAWNTGNHPSGVYFYRLRHGGFMEVKKMTLLK